MAQCDPQVFSGITPAQYATLVQKAQAAGIGISGDSGSASKLGGTIVWDYVPDTQVLTIQCTSTPLFTSCDYVNEQIQTLLKQSLG